MGVHINTYIEKREFKGTGRKVPIKFIAEAMHTSTKFIQECIKQQHGKFADFGTFVDRGKYGRNTYFVTDIELYDRFGIEYYG